MVMIFSSDSNNSDQVYRELFIAANNKVVIIPFKIEDVELNPRIGFLLAGTHWLDAISPPMQEQINILVTRVKLILSGPHPPPPPPPPTPEPARRIPIWAWLIFTLVLILVIGGASVYLREQTSKAVPFASPVPALTNVPEISAAQALGPQSEQARTFAEPILTAIAQRKPDFEEDFSTVNPDWGFCTSPGTSAIEAGVARFQISQGDSCMWNDKALTGKDFVLQFDSRLVSGDTTSQIMIHFHNVTNSHHFWLSLTPAIQAWDITKQWGGDFPMLASGEGAVSSVGETTQITMITQGSRFALYLNQTPMGFFEDRNLDNAGKTIFHCMTVSPAVCEFDNVKFWNLANIPGLP
jgi:hypothetical protein